MLSKFSGNKKYILVNLPKYRIVKHYYENGDFDYIIREYPNEFEKRRVHISDDRSTLYMSVGIFWREFEIVD